MTLTQFFVEDEAKAGIAKVFETGSRIIPKLPVEKISGLIHKSGKEVSLGEIKRRTINKAAPAANPSVVSPVEERIEIATSRVTTDHRLENIHNARAVEHARRTRNMARYWDHEIIHGDASADAEQMSGFKPRCTGSQLISMGNDGAVLTLAKFEEFLDTMEDMGGERYVFTNKKTARKLKGLILAAAGGATVADVTETVFKYEGWNIVTLDRKHDNTPVLPQTEVKGSSGAVCSSMYGVCTSPEEKVGVKVLLASNSIEIVEEGIRDSMYVDVIELAFGLAVYDERAIARLEGIKLA